TPTVVCGSGLSVDGARLRVSRGQNLTLRAMVTLTPAIDPVQDGIVLRIENIGGPGAIVRAIPGGAPLQRGGSGWTNSGTGGGFRDRGFNPGGITNILISDRSSVSPGSYKLQVTGKRGNFQIPPAELPVRIVLFAGPAASQCATG